MRIRNIFVIIAIIASIGATYAQNDQYLGKNKDVYLDELIQKAQNTDFSNGVSALIFSDEKNAYFAVDESRIESDYVRIRILEQSYSDKHIVNIGPGTGSSFIIFLVNNDFNVPTDKIIEDLENFYKKAKKEESLLTDEQKKDWLSKHNKFTKTK